MLHPRGMPSDSFPLEAWRRLLLQAHDESHRDLLGGGAAAGLPALREAIVRHVALNRGIACTAEQVLVVGGPREGATAIARQLLRRGETVAIEDPSHPSLPQLFATLGQQVQGVPLDEQGLVVEHLQRHADDARAVYLHPLSQYPLVQRSTAERGAALLAWAARRKAWIVEGQFNDEWVPPGQQGRSLFSRDPAGRVLVMNTLEGVMFPSVRVGYLLLPLAIAADFIRAHARRGERVPLTTQWAVAQFIDRGLMNEHLRRMRDELQTRRAAVRRHLAQGLPAAVRIGAMDSGAQCCLHLPACLPDVLVHEALRGRHIAVDCLSRMQWHQHGLNGVVIGYMGWSEARVLQSLQVICEVIAELWTNRETRDAPVALAS